MLMRIGAPGKVQQNTARVIALEADMAGRGVLMIKTGLYGVDEEYVECS